MQTFLGSVRLSVGAELSWSQSLSEEVLLCCVLLSRLVFTAASLNTVEKGCLAPAIYTPQARGAFWVVDLTKAINIVARLRIF